MNQSLSLKINKELEDYVVSLASANNLMWFYNLHQKEVVKSAKKLLSAYPDANEDIVIIACWLHDISKFHAKNDEELSQANKNHHVKSADIAICVLEKYELPTEDMASIKNCILRHRNSGELTAQTLEEKIVSVADTLSHFANVFYLTYFKFHPEKSIDDMVADDLEKLERDWQDLSLLPGSQEIAKEEYEFFKRILSRYSGN